MKITPKFNVRRFQMGGAVAPEEAPVEQAAPVEEGAPAESVQDPMQMLVQVAAQALQTQDCQAAMQVCQALVEMIQQAQGGAPEEAGQPVFRKGGILVRRIKK